MAVAKKQDVGQLVRTLRERLALTQERFAGKLGVTFATVNRWENGRSKPSPLAMKQLGELTTELGVRGRDLRKKYFSD